VGGWPPGFSRLPHPPPSETGFILLAQAPALRDACVVVSEIFNHGIHGPHGMLFLLVFMVLSDKLSELFRVFRVFRGCKKFSYIQ
jgi:hypothetical protein